MYAEPKPDKWRERVEKGEQTYAMWLDMKKSVEVNAREEEEVARRRWLAAGGRP